MNTENIDDKAEIAVAGDRVRLSIGDGYVWCSLTSDQARRAGLALLQAAFTTCAGPAPEAKPEPKAGVTRVWHSASYEPPGVTKVVDREGDEWTRHAGGWRLDNGCGDDCCSRSWECILNEYGPLTEAAPAVESAPTRPEPRVWHPESSIAHEQPDGVAKVRDREGDLWELSDSGRWVQAKFSAGCRLDCCTWAWSQLLGEYGPLTEVTA